MAVTITSNGGGATAAISLTEGNTAATTVIATRPALSYAITGGADAAKFSINSTTGALTFLVAPDYEGPTDIGANNVYDVEVTVTDSVNSSTDVQTLAITISDVAEGGGGGGSGATYYVATTGSDSNNGTSTSTPWLTLQKAVNTAVAGDTVYVKAGNYGNQKINTVRAGTTGEPISFIGYTSIPGDNPAYTTWNHTSSTPNTALMPCIDAGTRENSSSGLLFSHAFIHISGFTVSNFQWGCYVSGADCSAARIYTREHGTSGTTYSGMGIFIQSTAARFVCAIGKVVNANAQAITLGADNCVLDQMSAACNNNTSNGDPTSGPTDYYFNVTGSNNTVTNTYIYRTPGLNHGGHGLELKGLSSNVPVTGNVFDGFECHNMAGGVGDRHESVYGNTFRNGVIYGDQAIGSRDGAHNNTYEDIVIHNASRGLWLIDTNEDPDNTENVSARDNTYQRITFNNVGTVIDFGTYVDVNATASGNTFDSFTVNGASKLYGVGHFASATNILQNSTLNNIPTKAVAAGGRVVGDNQTAVSNVTLNNCGFTLS